MVFFMRFKGSCAHLFDLNNTVSVSLGTEINKLYIYFQQPYSTQTDDSTRRK